MRCVVKSLYYFGRLCPEEIGHSFRLRSRLEAEVCRMETLIQVSSFAGRGRMQCRFDGTDTAVRGTRLESLQRYTFFL